MLLTIKKKHLIGKTNYSCNITRQIAERPVLQIREEIASVQTAVVETVLDGDTFRLNTGETVRLAEVDAPEAGSPNYVKALERLKQLIEEKVILLDQRTVDTNGRIVADVWVGSLYVNDEMHRFLSLL